MMITIQSIGNSVSAWYETRRYGARLQGIDHEKPAVRHNGIDRRLTDVHGRIVREILA